MPSHFPERSKQMKPMNETDTYHALLWFLHATGDFHLPTYYDVKSRIYDDNEMYSYEIVGPERIKVREYTDQGRCIWVDVYDYSDLTSVRI